MTSVRVVIADDHPVVRTGIRDILENARGIEVVGEASTGTEALEEVEAKGPDVLLLDVEMPEHSGVEVARRLQARSSPTRLLALSSYEDQEYVRGLLEEGASGYMTKDNAPALIVEAVRAVAEGKVRWFVRPEETEAPSAALTPQEKRVLRHLARGRSNEAIARALSVSTSTVRTHVTNAYRKIGVETAREAIAWAWKQGLLEHPSGEGPSDEETPP